MKKYLSVLVLSIFIIPSITFASWWNPLSWFDGWTSNKTEVALPLEIQKTSEEKINELQKQLDELKNEKPDSASTTTTSEKTEVKKTASKTTNSTTIKSTQVVDVCLNIAGIQTTTPLGYSWGYGNICSVINLTDYCPNINGVQSAIPDGMFVYGSKKECLTQNEINYIAEKMAEEKDEGIAKQTKSNDPIFSEECENAQASLEKINAQQANMDQTNYRALADFVVQKVNPALDKVDIACRLDLAPRKVEIPKTTNCYASYYSNNANITCYSN